MDEKNLLDVSSSILFEATGDSEVDANMNLAKSNEVYMDVAEDDAMSCSFDTSDNAAIDEFDDYDHGSSDFIEGCDNCYVEYVSDDDEDEGVVNQAWKGEKMVLPKKLSAAKVAEKPQKSSNVYVDPSMKLINQREQDRLFWEACLAS